MKRGNIAQIRQQENLMLEIIKIGVTWPLKAFKKWLLRPVHHLLASFSSRF